MDNPNPYQSPNPLVSSEVTCSDQVFEIVEMAEAIAFVRGERFSSSHAILALNEHPNRSYPASLLLKSCNVSLAKLYEALMVQCGDGASPVRPNWNLLNEARQEAEELSSPYAFTEYVLLAALRWPDDRLEEAWRQIGVNGGECYRRLRDAISSQNQTK